MSDATAEIMLACEMHAFCPHYPAREGVPHVLRHNRKLTEWWYESTCCRKRKPHYNLPRPQRTLVDALRIWPAVRDVLIACGVQGDLPVARPCIGHSIGVVSGHE